MNKFVIFQMALRLNSKSLTEADVGASFGDEDWAKSSRRKQIRQVDVSERARPFAGEASEGESAGCG